MVLPHKAYYRFGLALATVALCILAFNPCIAIAVAAQKAVPSEKDETVHIYADASGAVTNTQVDVTLKNPDAADTLVDSSDLADIEADDEQQQYSAISDEIIWTADGANVKYSGSSSKEAPVSLRVKYFLDGTEVSSSQIAGKSGHVVIRYDYENNAPIESSLGALYTPLTAVTAIMFNGEDFKNVQVANGRLVEDSSQTIVIGYAMPGLKKSLGSAAEDARIPEFVEIEADAENFELRSSLTMVTAGFMEDLDLDSINVAELSDTSSGLTEATDQLVDGAAALSEGLDTLATGTNSLAQGATDLNYGAARAAASLPELVQAIEALDSAASELSGGSTKLAASVNQFKALLESSNPGDVSIGSLNATALLALDGITGTLTPEDQACVDAARQALEANSSLISQASANLGQLASGADTMAAGAKQLAAGLNALQSESATIVSGMNQLIAGTSELASGARELAAGTKAAADGSGALTEGLKAYRNEAISQIADAIDNKVVNLVDRLEVLSQAARDYDNFSGITDGTTGSVKFVIETDAVTADE